MEPYVIPLKKKLEIIRYGEAGMKILLVYPEFPDTFWSFKHALKFVHKKAGAPPLGLLTVAAMLPSGWEKNSSILT